MAIYQINDIANTTTIFVCPDQATVDEATANNLSGTFIVGTQEQANTILASSQETMIQTSEFKEHISAVKSVDKDADGNKVWVSCDIHTETDNTNIKKYC